MADRGPEADLVPGSDVGPSPSTSAIGELAPEVHTQHTSVRRGSTRRLVVAALVGLVTIVGLAWLGLDALGGGDAPQASTDEGVDEGASGASSADLSPAPFVDDDVGPAELVARDPIEGADGLSLYVAFAQRVDGGPAIWHLDLGRGTWSDTSHRGTPLAATDDAVVVVRQLREQSYVAAIPVDDGRQRVLANGFQLVVDDRRQPAPEGSVWLLGPDGEDRFVYRRVDLETGDVLDRFDAPLPEWDSVDAPSLMTASGEIFARIDDAYVAVGDGRVMAAGPDLALIETCDAPDSCQLSWRSGPTLEPIDRPLPPDNVTTVWAMSDDGSIVVYSSDRAGFDVWVFHPESGERSGPYSAGLGGFPLGSIISPDQRFVAVPSGPSLVVLDVETGDEYALDTGTRAVEGLTWASHAETFRQGRADDG